jgi:hypothetical protein
VSGIRRLPLPYANNNSNNNNNNSNNNNNNNNKLNKALYAPLTVRAE